MSTIEKQLCDIVNELQCDFEQDNNDDITIFNHPDKEAIIDILTNLRKIVFLGYFRNRAIKVRTQRNSLSMLVEDVFFKLVKQIKIVLNAESEDDDVVTEKAMEITFSFINRMRKIKEYIDSDVQAAYDGDPAAYSIDEIIYSYPGLFATFVNRVAHELYLLGVPIIPRMMTEYAHSKTGIDIHPGASIGKNFFIDHGTGIVIGETTVIGDNVKIYQGVTLGALSTRGGQQLKNKKRHPTIEDNVTIYSGASILGGDTVIGKNVVIGGNAFITCSVPEGAKVSIRSQELKYDYGKDKTIKTKEYFDDDSWFYVI
ncbi:serine O-acetyltransferase EpsC [Ruminococcus flavefaciens]|uniref:Serine O-acetyltransferase n=1 Tax=Ruminococcus flavefaciens TaxID=1265 RepID=A0A1M7K4P9_RUMFL|nr:serine O-acetyltransferase EpsC [Ruminococcus flavefaciens]SHM60236.1 serine O-acetyltransferase [Ruminococcus flavefaciens]